MPKPDENPTVEKTQQPEGVNVSALLPNTVIVPKPDGSFGYLFQVPSTQQLQMHLQTLCPPSICSDLASIAIRMSSQMAEAIRKTRQEHRTNG